MTQQLIVLGTTDNDRTGEGLREGGVKIQANFTELYHSVGSRTLALSNYPGIDPTGATDSFAAVQAAVNAVAGTGITLMVDCPVYIQAGLDYTKTVFFPSNTNLFFTVNGKFIVDGVGVPPFAFYDAHDCTWANWNVEYIAGIAPSTTGSFGAVAMGYGTLGGDPFGTAVAQSNNVTMTGHLQNLYNTTGGVSGVNFTGGQHAVSGNPANMSALFQIRGNCYRLNFLNGRCYVPDGVTADFFIPMVANIGPSWIEGSTATISSAINQTNCAFPYNITFDGVMLDGCMMGLQGSPGNIVIKNVQAYRYTDFQDNSGGTNNVGGVCPTNPPYNMWFPPPHLIYMDSYGSPTPVVGPAFSAYIENVIDYGVYVGTPTRRSTSSGYMNSLKLECSSGTVVNGYVSYRPDGGLDCLSSNFANGIVKGLAIEFDSSSTANSLVFFASPPSGTTGTLQNIWNFPTATLSTTLSTGQVVNATYTNMSTAVTFAATLTGTPTATATMVSQQNPAFALRFPSPVPVNNLELTSSIVDVAGSPRGFPIVSSGQASTNIKLNVNITMSDWPLGVAWVPGFIIAGNNINVTCQMNFLACSSTTGNQGMFWNTANYTITNSKFTAVVHGWRAFTNVTYSSYKNRIRPNTAGSLSNTYEVIDTANNWRGVVEDGILMETWSQGQQVTPAAGATYTTSIQFPSYFSFDRYSYWISGTPPAGPTSISVGWGANPAGLISNAGVTTGTNVASAQPAPITQPGTAIILTANGSNFTGTGTVQIGVRGNTMSAAS